MVSEDRLVELVDCYQRTIGADVSRELHWFGCSKQSLAEAIMRATRSRVPNGTREIMHSHQRRIGTNKLAELQPILLEHMDAIVAAKNFESLHKVIGTAIGARSGIGQLAIYDISIRLAFYNGIRPNDVYLHCGTRDGARRVIDIPRGVTRLRASDFPAPVSSLEPYHIECFLCLGKKYFTNDDEPDFSQSCCFVLPSCLFNECPVNDVGLLSGKLV